MKKLTSALIIVCILAYSISFAIVVYALPGDLIWKKTSNPSSGWDEAYGVAVDGTGVYIVGYDQRPGDWRWRIEKRSLTDGTLIWKKTSNPSSGMDTAYSVALDDTGVYLVGSDERLGSGDSRWRMEKRSITDGNRIWCKWSNPSGSVDVAHGVAVDGTGIYVVGYDRRSGAARWRMEKRSLTDGSRIWIKTCDPSLGYDEAYGVAVDGTGVYIVGTDFSLGNPRWRIEKRSLTDGSRIWKKTVNPSSDDDVVHGVAVDGTGVYIVGHDERLGDARWRIEKRSTTDGTLIWKKTSNPKSGWEDARDVTVDGTGVYIVGYDMLPSGTRWRMEKRSLTDGSLIWRRWSNPTYLNDEANGVAVDGTGVYIVGFDKIPGPARWRIEKRNL